MNGQIKNELIGSLNILSAIIDVLSTDMNSLYLAVGYNSPNSRRIESLILESKRGLSNLKQLFDKESNMEFSMNEEKVEVSESAGPAKAAVNPQQKKAETLADTKPKPNEDEVGVSLSIPEDIRVELHKVIFALNNVANYMMDQITVTNRVFARYIAGVYQMPVENVFKDLEEESKELQKIHERDDRAEDADIVDKDEEKGVPANGTAK